MSWRNWKSPNLNRHRRCEFCAAGYNAINFVLLHQFVSKSKWCLYINLRRDPPEALLDNECWRISYRVTELYLSLVARLLGISTLIGSSIFYGVKSQILGQVEKEARRVSSVAAFSTGGPRVRSIAADDLGFVSFLILRTAVYLLAALPWYILIILPTFRNSQENDIG